MTQVPPAPTGPQDGSAGWQGAPLQYAPATRTSGMAMASMILGIVAIPMMACFGLGLILSVIALVLGLVSLVKINKNPMQLGGLGFAITGMVLGAVGTVFVMPLLVAIMLPSLGKARELANRSACAANMKGIVVACVVYSAENGELFPTAGKPAAPGGYVTALGVGSAATSANDAVLASHTTTGAAGNPTACVWILVNQSAISPKQLLCKSDPWGRATPAAELRNPAGQYYLTPQEANQISYSIAYPWASLGYVAAWWRNLSDSSLPVMSDMAPFNGTGSPVRNVLATTATAGWPRVASSFNHQGDGQNVAYSDAHNEFNRTPLADQLGCSIWTTGSGPIGVSPPAGSVGVGPFPTLPPYDTIMVPRRDGGTGELR